MWITRRLGQRRLRVVVGLSAAAVVMGTATGAVAFQSERSDAAAAPPPVVVQEPAVQPPAQPAPGLLTPSGRRPLVIGHKGAVKAAARNTLPAMRAAFEAGADGIEFDIVRTKDNHIVVMSNTNLGASTSNCHGHTEDHTWAYVRTCRTFDGALLPTLDDALAVVRENDGKIFLHVKIQPNRAIAAKIMEEINEYGLNNPERATIFGPWGQMLDMLLAQGAPRVGLLFNSSHQKQGWAANYPVLIPYNTPVTAELVTAAQARGVEVYPVESWPLTVPEALAMNVDGMILDSISEAREAVGPVLVPRPTTPSSDAASAVRADLDASGPGLGRGNAHERARGLAHPADVPAVGLALTPGNGAPHRSR